MAIKTLKLITGEDVIADCTFQDDKIILENPVQVTLVPTRTSNQPNFGFVPFPLTSNDKKITIGVNHVIFSAEPAEEFLTQYNAIFGSGIITPPKGIIV